MLRYIGINLKIDLPKAFMHLPLLLLFEQNTKSFHLPLLQGQNKEQIPFITKEEPIREIEVTVVNYATLEMREKECKIRQNNTNRVKQNRYLWQQKRSKTITKIYITGAKISAASFREPKSVISCSISKNY